MAESPCGARAHDGVQLVDEGDDLPVAVLDLGQDGLQPLLELAPVLGARDHRAEVERDQLLVLQGLRHVPLDDALRESFHDGRLADAGLTDQYGVVLRTARQHLHHAADLLVPADDRVQPALARGGREVGAELLQGLVLALRVRRGHPASSPCLLERGLQLLRTGPLPVQHLARLAALGRDPDEQVLGGEVVVAQLLRPLGAVGDDGEQRAVGLGRRDGGAADAGQRGQQPVRPGPYLGLVGVHRDEQVGDVLVVLALEQGEEQVRGGQVGVARRHRAVGGGVERGLALVRQLGVHVRSLLLGAGPVPVRT